MNDALDIPAINATDTVRDKLIEWKFYDSKHNVLWLTKENIHVQVYLKNNGSFSVKMSLHIDLTDTLIDVPNCTSLVTLYTLLYQFNLIKS